MLLFTNIKSLQSNFLQVIDDTLFNNEWFLIFFCYKFFPVVPNNFHGICPCAGVLIVEILEEESSVDEYFILLIGDFHIGKVKSIVGLEIVFLLSEGVFAGLNGLGVIFEFEVAHGKVGIGELVVLVVLLDVLEVVLNGFVDVVILELLVSFLSQGHLL